MVHNARPTIYADNLNRSTFRKDLAPPLFWSVVISSRLLAQSLAFDSPWFPFSHESHEEQPNAQWRKVALTGPLTGSEITTMSAAPSEACARRQIHSLASFFLNCQEIAKLPSCCSEPAYGRYCQASVRVPSGLGRDSVKSRHAGYR